MTGVIPNLLILVHYFRVPKDSLDLVLTTTYNQSTETFADKVDLHLQAETIGCETWRRLRNTFDKKPPKYVPMVSFNLLALE